MILKIDGIDITPYIKSGGVKWGRNDVDGAGAGRTMDGTMHRSRVATKIRLDITCMPLTADKTRILLNAIHPEYVQVEYSDPKDGLVVKTMYSNNVPATHMVTNTDGTDTWNGIAFPLIER